MYAIRSYYDVLPKDYPELDFSLMKIVLYEAAPRLLNGMSDKSGKDAVRFLEKLGVEVKLNTMIKDFDGEKITLSEGKTENISNLLWTAGVSGKPLKGIDEKAYGRAGRIKVDAFNRINGLDNVFSIGDSCIMDGDNNYPNGHPQVAQVAIQQAHHSYNFV